MTPERKRLLIQMALFAATVFTTTASGASAQHRDGAMFPLRDGLSYSIPLLLILVCHEFGHYFAALWHRVPASLPYFIPLPPGIGLFGTMGAVIGMAAPTADRRKLIDIGAAGPLAGMAVAIPVLWYGISLSPVEPISSNGLQEGNSILYALVKFGVKGAWLPAGGTDVNLHPTAWAGWAGLFITMMNLIPIGQLDGGHVATAYFGNEYRPVARVFHRSLPVLAVAAFAWVYLTLQREVGTGVLPAGLTVFSVAITPAISWMVWFLLLALMGRMSGGLEHPLVGPVSLPPSRRALFWLVAITFVVTFMPVPLRPNLRPVEPAAVGAPSEASP